MELMSALVGEKFISSHYSMIIAAKAIFLKYRCEEILL